MASRARHTLSVSLSLISVAAAAGAVSEDDTVVADQVVVTATRIPTAGEKLGSSVTVITAEEIARRQYRGLAEALRSVAGLRVVRLGGPGQQTSVFIRGASSSQTLLLIDGTNAADPSNPSGAVDFSNLLVDNVERIEIIRGPQSTLYGSQAIGGVINVITRKGEGSPSASLKLEGGSNSTANQFLTAQGATSAQDYSMSLTHLKTHGDSVTPERLREGKPEEADRYRNYSASGRLGTRLTEDLKVNLFGRYIDSRTDIDPEVGPFDPASFAFNTAEDPDAELRNEEYLLRGEGRLSLLEGLWESLLAVSYTHYDRRTDNDRQDPAQTFEQVHYLGDTLEFSLENDFYLSEQHTLSAGIGTRKETLDSSGFREFPSPPFPPFVVSEDSDADARTNYAFAQDQFSFASRVFGTLGVRVDDHDEFGSQLTYRFTGAYKHPETGSRITASAGTGFRAPSLFELYGFSPNNFGSAYIGNPELDPETSFGWDLGFEQALAAERFVLGVTYFRNDIDDLIQLVTDPATFNQTSENVDQVEIQGVESFVDATPFASLQLRASYTYQDVDQQDESADTEVVRRPRDQASLDIDYDLTARVKLWLGIDYVGQRKDVIRAYDSAETISLKSYTTADLTASYQASPEWRLFGRVENLTDEHYEPADGFQAPGRVVIVGAQLNI
jgi:vitamin B12 transporter